MSAEPLFIEQHHMPRAALLPPYSPAQNDAIRALRGVAAGMVPAEQRYLDLLPEAITLREIEALRTEIGTDGIFHLGMLAVESERSGDYATAVFCHHALKTHSAAKVQGGRRKSKPSEHSRQLARELDTAIEARYPSNPNHPAYQKTLHGILND